MWKLLRQNKLIQKIGSWLIAFLIRLLAHSIRWNKNIPFYESLSKDKMINERISNNELKKMFNLNYHTKKINLIFKRIFK